MRCDALNFGSPSMTRCSQVTWFRSSLLKTPQIQRGLFHCRQYFATVISSAMLFICIAPSPTTAMTGRSGCANLAAIAYGTAAPIDASPPDSEHFMPRRIFRSRAYQLAQEPESLVMIALSGSSGDNSQVTRCGLIGFAAAMARLYRVFHHLAVDPLARFRQARSVFCSNIGSSARSVSVLSPTRLTSIG